MGFMPPHTVERCIYCFKTRAVLAGEPKVGYCSVRCRELHQAERLGETESVGAAWGFQKIGENDGR